MIGRLLQRRLSALRREHQALYVEVIYAEPGVYPRWHIDAQIHHLGGKHRLGSGTTLREAMRQARAQVPGATIPLHPGGDDRKSCSQGSCQHFRLAHGRDYCRQPGCDCPGFLSWEQRWEQRKSSSRAVSL